MGLKLLYNQADLAETIELVRIAPDASPVEVRTDCGEKFLVLAGDLADEHGSYRAGRWVRIPAGHCAWRSSVTGTAVLRRTE